MMVIVGLVVLFIAAIVGTVGVLGNAGATHALAENFSVLGYHVTGSTGTLFLSGIVVGAVGLLGLSVLLAGARRSAAHPRIDGRWRRWTGCAGTRCQCRGNDSGGHFANQ